MSDKIINIRFKSPSMGKKIADWVLRFNYRWADGICKTQNLGENEFYLSINLTTGKMSTLSFFNPPEHFTEISREDFTGNEIFPTHPGIDALKKVLQKYSPEIESVANPVEIKAIEPKRKTFVARPGKNAPKWITERGIESYANDL